MGFSSILYVTKEKGGTKHGRDEEHLRKDPHGTARENAAGN